MTQAPHCLRFGPFELFEQLGGGMSIVYRARRTGDPRDVAVKLLRQERLLDGEARARFAREVRALQQLSHPGICPLQEAGEVDGMPFLCMPLLRGQSLAAWLAAVRLDGARELASLPGRAAQVPVWAHLVAVTAKLADALHAAHGRGFVHRDIKPANLWISEEGEPLLLDFGLVRDIVDSERHLTHTGQVVGTPTYLAPEHLEANLGPVDARADVYGLCAVLYELLTLVPPFSGSSREELFANILSSEPVDPRCYHPDLPEGLVVLLKVALAKCPGNRYPDAAALAADLRRVLRGEAVLARQPRPLSGCWQFAAKRPLWTAVCGVLAVVLGWSLVSVVLPRLGSVTDSEGAMSSLPWLGRLELARLAYVQLPPPWPQHRHTLARWLADHGQPLQRAPDGAERVAPGLRAFSQAAVADVTNRLEFADSAQERTVDSHAAAWELAAKAVAADVRFSGFTLLPQVGLVPLGADWSSGLQEFYDLASGDVSLPAPQRGADGQLPLTGRHGMVFVLLPGGTYQPLGRKGLVGIAPFLLAKHELTRAQHARLDQGNDPSYETLGVNGFGEQNGHRHPVDQVRCLAVVELLRRWGLELPTEVEWEYAARADCPKPDVAVAGNFAGNGDGFLGAAPVGVFQANGFGLHDMFGNVKEMCWDGDSTQPSAPSDNGRRCMLRGGGYGSAQWAIAAREQASAEQQNKFDGVRPVRRFGDS